MGINLIAKGTEETQCTQRDMVVLVKNCLAQGKPLLIHQAK